MTEDEEGFLYPRVDHDKCIKCFRCIQVCVFKRDQIEKGFFQSETEPESNDELR